MPAALVIVAAGVGSRVGADVNKVLLPLGEGTVLEASVRTALDVADIRRLVLVVRRGEERSVSDAVAPLLGGEGEAWLVTGGETRHESETRALEALADEIEAGEVDVVAIHDAARPLAEAWLFTAVVEAAREHGGAVPAAALSGVVTDRLAPVEAELVGVQTPQAFLASELLDAYRAATADGFRGSDTASCLERYAPDLRIVAVPSVATNLKITFPEDVGVAERLR